MDRPGLGHSERLPRDGESIFDQARVLRAAAQALGADKPIVLGQSYGAAVALAWAVDAPDGVAAVVSVAGVSHPWEGKPSAFFEITGSRLGGALAVPVMSALATRARIEGSLTKVFAPQPVPIGYAEHIGVPLVIAPTALRATGNQRLRLKDEIRQLAPRLPSIAVPVEIVHGTADDTVSYEEQAKQLESRVTGARLTTLPGVGHMPHQTHTSAVIDAIDSAARRAGLR